MNGRTCTAHNVRNMLVKRKKQVPSTQGIIGYIDCREKVVKIDLWHDNLAQNGQIMQADVF